MGSSSGSASKNSDLPVLQQIKDESDLELFYPNIIKIEPDSTDVGSLTDFELMKRVLAVIESKRDLDRLAHRLLANFGSFAKTLAAPYEELLAIDGVGKRTLLLFRVVQQSAIRIIRADLMNEPILNQYEAVQEYLFARLSHEQEEKFLVLFLNHQNRLIADEILASGSDIFVNVDARMLLKRILNLRATAIIMVHNHPSGNAWPSPLDLAHTKKICAACSAVGIIVHDHYIVGNGVITRLKRDGHLKW
jgi:DNA repair protein RadC